jgi:hypothetical protein
METIGSKSQKLAEIWPIELNCKIKIGDKLKTKEERRKIGGHMLLGAKQGGPQAFKKKLGLKVPQFTTLLCRTGLRSIR